LLVRHITGVAFLVNKLVAKRLELLVEVAPKARPIGMLIDPNNPNAESDVEDAQAAAVALGRRLIIAKAGTQNELDAGFATLVENRAAALFVAPNANFRIRRNRLLALVAQHKLPSSYSNADFVRAGGRMSYWPDQTDVYRLSGRPLRGANSQRGKARGTSGDVADQIRFRAQPQDRQGARPHDPPVSAGTRCEIIE
jgi:ABC-type uncharacterized transport system substrate-binding protein